MTLRSFNPPPRPADEAARLDRLRSLAQLDTPPDPELEAIVRQAAALFAAPIGLVTLVDADRQWFKARCGLDTTETPRAVSFCGHAILAAEPLVVLDATKDSRFAGNPLVIADPNVVFYLGVPLVTADGHAIGTLCIIDHRPRDRVDPTKLEAAKQLARRAMARLEGAPAADRTSIP